jgi:co-chaperonin GroES (HSP10)
MPDSVRQKGKVFIPDWARCLRGKVIAKGPDATEVEIGDSVSFVATAGMESVFQGAAVRVMREDDIDGVFE